MAEDANEFGVSCRRWMPLTWRSQTERSRTPERTAWLNQMNENRLRTLLERETRERPPPDFANLEALVIEVLHCVKQPPPARSVVLSADSVEWIETSPKLDIKPGDSGLVCMCPDPEVPYEVEFCAEIRSIERETRGRLVKADLMLRSDRVVELYQQLVFIYHRRAQRDSKSGSG